MGPRKGQKRGVREILLMGVFWRILFIEAVLLVYSLFYRWITEDAGAQDLFWYAVRIIILVGIIIVFMMVTLKKFLTRKIIIPLESIAEANRRTRKDFSNPANVALPQDTPDEIRDIVSSRESMLKKIIDVSNERLGLVNFIRETFGRYLSQKVVDEILASPKARQAGGSRKTITVLMADLRGFTRMSESRDPEEMVRLLNQYLEAMSRIILRYDGLIDEIIGDSILAVFGAPEAHENDPERAVACAIEMQNAMIELNREMRRQGYPDLEMGIGINTGNVILGNIGSEVRMKYGIVGDAVNRVSRIESNSTGGQVLIGETTFKQIRTRLDTASPRSMMMKGVKDPLVFYSVTAIEIQGMLLSLHPHADPGHCVEIRLPFQCWPVRNKRVDAVSFSGETVSMDEHRIKVATDRPIDPLMDVKLRFDFCVEAHCFDDIYAKCMGPDAEPGISQLRITAIEEKDRSLIREWISQVSQ